MMDLKLWLSVLMFCGMYESQSWKNNWFIYVPSRVSVLESSCVDIPCVYVYPKTKRKLNRWRGFWFRRRTIVTSNFHELRLSNEFHGRTRMTGRLDARDCSWEMGDVRRTDTGPFYFRIELPQLGSFSYSKNTVTLDVFRVPKPPIMSVKVLDTVTATCRVSHVCPRFPPTFVWSHSGRKKTNSKAQNSLTYFTTSTLTFTPQEDDFNKHLECKVRYTGGKTTKASVLLIKKRTK